VSKLRQLATALLLGLAVAIGLVAMWSVLLAANLRVAPQIPWSIVGTGVALAAAWRALCAWRAGELPRRCYSPAHRSWAFAAAGALMGGAFFATLLTIRLAHAPIAALPEASSSQPALAVAYFAMASIVAGVAEETGFRGILQHGLERLVTRRAAFAGVALAFCALHFGNPEFLAFAPIYITSSLGLSHVVAASGSLWPGIAAHAMADFFSYALLLACGVDALHGLSSAWVTALMTLTAGSLVLALAALHRLGRLPRTESLEAI
jgi:membrane protease YdiL (CAAX protease family)